MMLFIIHKTNLAVLESSLEHTITYFDSLRYFVCYVSKKVQDVKQYVHEYLKKMHKVKLLLLK
jgi:hypothetical protein